MKRVIGIDEVGYGAWAGPVTVGAVVFPVPGRDTMSSESPIQGLRDSKKLTENVRNRMSKEVTAKADYWVIVQSSSKQIDRFGVKVCRDACMKWCAKFCKHYFSDAHIIVDGNDFIAGIGEHQIMKQADDKIPAVSAASVIAKVYRDTQMIRHGERYPRYDFRSNKGYHSNKHVAALDKYGICPQHRKSYKPIKERIK